MKEVVLNNRGEVIDWLKENYKRFCKSAYLKELSVVGTRIKLIGGSDKGGVSSNISFPTSMEKYPVKFTESEDKISVNGRSNFWLLNMLFQELTKRRLGY